MYRYEEIKPQLFTEENQKLFLALRDQIHNRLRVSGAITMAKAIELPNGIGAAGSWEMMACVDRLVELNEIIEIPTDEGPAQDRIFIGKYI